MRGGMSGRLTEEARNEAGGGEVVLFAVDGEVIDDGADDFEGDVGHGVAYILWLTVLGTLHVDPIPAELTVEYGMEEKGNGKTHDISYVIQLKFDFHETRFHG